MREFFRGWRRKAGLVMLAMALVLFVAWMRSFANQENVTVHRAPSWDYIVHSRDGRLYWMRDQISYGRFELWSIPYWSLVLPLTLLSAWLILGRRMKSKPPA
jgi:hypothetical protein